jgi:hypothetical protein
MPRKMSVGAISMIEISIIAISEPSVVLERATHLYRSPVPLVAAGQPPAADSETAVGRLLSVRDRARGCERGPHAVPGATSSTPLAGSVDGIHAEASEASGASDNGDGSTG